MPEALDWLDSVTLPRRRRAAGGGARTRRSSRSAPTSRSTCTARFERRQRPLLRRLRPAKPLGHYSAFRAHRRRRLCASSMPRRRRWRRPRRRRSRRSRGRGRAAATVLRGGRGVEGAAAAAVIARSTREGYWLAPLGYNSHPYQGRRLEDASPPGDFSHDPRGRRDRHVAVPGRELMGISIEAYIRNMSVLIRRSTHRAEAMWREAARRGVPSRRGAARRWPRLRDRPVRRSRASASPQSIWRIDNLDAHRRPRGEGGRRARVVVQTDAGPAVEFDGADDGLVLDVESARRAARVHHRGRLSSRQPTARGTALPALRRRRHSENRALIELRMLPGGRWCARHLPAARRRRLTLLDRERTHPAGRVARGGADLRRQDDDALRGRRARRARGDVAFTPLAAGRTSIGVRQNRVSWFKGRIRAVASRRRCWPAIGATATAHDHRRSWPEGVPGAKADGGAGARRSTAASTTCTTRRSPHLAADRAPPTRHGGHRLPRRRLRAAGDGQRSGRRGRAAAAARRRDVRPQVSARRVRPSRRRCRMCCARFGLVRSRAAEFGVEPDRIGVFGASAGGHLAAAGRHAVRRARRADRRGARRHQRAAGFRRAALSRGHDDDRSCMPTRAATCWARRRPRRSSSGLSIETQVRARHAAGVPRAHGGGPSVPLENSLRWYEALRAARACRSKLHLYERGAHGFGIARRPGHDFRLVDALDRVDAGARLAAARSRRRAAHGRSPQRRRTSRAGRAASRVSARPTSATARSSTRSSPAIIPTRRS